MGRVLLVGSSSGVLEIAQKIKAYGHQLIVLGGEVNDPCHQLADESVIVDYRDAKKSCDMVNSLEFEFIVPGSNDIAFETSHEIAKHHRPDFFDSSYAIQMLHNKSGFRHLLSELKLRQPKSYRLSDLSKIQNTIRDNPILVKPELSFSGKGISVVAERALIEPAIELAKSSSRNQQCILEEFIDGELYSISAFLENGILKYAFFVNEFCFTNPFAVCASFTPSNLPGKLQQYVSDSVSKIANHLNLKNGLIHVQFMVNKNEEVFLIECMRRMIGDFYAKNIMHAYGIDYYDLYLRPYLGMPYKEYNLANQKPKKIARTILCEPNEFLFDGVQNPHNLDILEYIPLETIGKKVAGYPEGKAGIVFYRCDENIEKVSGSFLSKN